MFHMWGYMCVGILCFMPLMSKFQVNVLSFTAISLFDFDICSFHSQQNPSTPSNDKPCGSQYQWPGGFGGFSTWVPPINPFFPNENKCSFFQQQQKTCRKPADISQVRFHWFLFWIAIRDGILFCVPFSSSLKSLLLLMYFWLKIAWFTQQPGSLFFNQLNTQVDHFPVRWFFLVAERSLVTIRIC